LGQDGKVLSFGKPSSLSFVSLPSTPLSSIAPSTTGTWLSCGGREGADDVGSLKLVHEEDDTEGNGDKELTKLVLDEDRTLGEVTCSTYYRYAESGGLLSSFFVFFLFVAGQVILMYSEYWLKVWAEADDQSSNSYFYVFLGLCCGASVIGLARSLFFFLVSIEAASTLHNKALAATMACPMSFFISNPLGRVLNKFSSDQGQSGPKQNTTFLFSPPFE